jgi:hypothetical protein
MCHITTDEIMNEVALEALVRGLKSFALEHRTAEHHETLIDEMAPFQRGKTLLYMHKRANRASSASVIWHILSFGQNLTYWPVGRGG